METWDQSALTCKKQAAARSGIDVFLVPPAGFSTVERIGRKI